MSGVTKNGWEVSRDLVAIQLPIYSLGPIFFLVFNDILVVCLWAVQ